MTPCGRFAPSPTGRLHLGNARTALLAWLWARAQQGRFLLRVEDLDPERSRADAVDDLLDDFRYLELPWDGGVVRQSERREAHRAALQHLIDAAQVYPCYCSRAEIARAASAPHGDEGPRYPGICASLNTAERAERGRTRTPAWRFRVPPGEVTFVDQVRGAYRQDVHEQVGDFVVARGDGIASYQLAVVVDDDDAGVTQVLRGDDLLASTPRQLLLCRALGLSEPTYAHVPLLLGPDGSRLAKREGGMTVREYREAKIPVTRLLGWLADSVGLGEDAPSLPEAFLGGFRLDALAASPARCATAWARVPIPPTGRPA